MSVRVRGLLQVLDNDQLETLLAREKDISNVLGVARSRFVIRLDKSRSVVIFGEDRDHMQTVVCRLTPRTLPTGHVRSYMAQMCAICADLHARGFVLQGALQLSSFALDRCDHVFLLSSTVLQKADTWKPIATNPLYVAPEILCSSQRRQEQKMSSPLYSCDSCE